MKCLYIFMSVAVAGVMLLTTGCSTPAPQPVVTTTKGDVEFTAEVSATITADQKIVMDGKKYEVADIPKQLAKKNASKYITIVVMPESKMTRQTLGEVIKTLVQNDYYVVMGAKSKYADEPVPARP